MANVDQPNGLTPVRHLGGGLVRANAYRIASGLASNIFSGDLVKSTGTNKQIDVCGVGDKSVGVFAGCQYVDANGDVQFRPYWATGTATSGAAAAVAYVYDDPEIAFEIQSDEDVVAADIGGIADIVAGAGNTSTGRSGFELDSSDITATTSDGGQLKIIELVDRPDNAYGDQAKVLVLINEHELRAGSTAGSATEAV